MSLSLPRSPHRLSARLSAACVLAAAISSPAFAQAEISEFELFFELNATDGDVGLHGFLDADAWQSAEISGPGGAFTVLEAEANADSNEFGVNEFFFESNEPPLEERSFEELLTLFPGGVYEADVLTVDNEMLSEETELTADLPCPPVIDDPDTKIKNKKNEVTLSWTLTPGVYDPDEATCDDSEDVEVILVEAVIELENEETDEVRVFKADLAPDATEIEAPEEFLEGAADAGFEAKAEIIVTEESGNRTAVEIEFDLE